MRAVYMMMESQFEAVYTLETRSKIEALLGPVNYYPTLEALEADKEALTNVEFLFGGWGVARMDAAFLDLLPNLKVIYYAAGTMKKLLTDEVWKRGIRVTTANTANAIPVAEYTLGMILLSLKNTWQLIRQVKTEKTFKPGLFYPVTGNYQATVGLISFSQVGRMVVELLKPYHLNVIAYDPYVSAEEMAKYNVEKVELNTLFERANVASLHAPLLDSTVGMITGEHIKSLPEAATFINTARGAIVKEDEMIEELQVRPDLTAILDVTHPEPPVKESPLYTMENVILTPHLAGSAGNERARLGDWMLAELEEYLAEGKLSYEITKESYEKMA
ncbi:hydroxyacid dehydrogenase [Jeotgalibaca sp. A127]|uniref:hydroxyacid dehydrogenase n=1 Tax=Jeotgalibaca sp. A127 TaxID=3457324 RepID=UPI003FD13F4E